MNPIRLAPLSLLLVTAALPACSGDDQTSTTTTSSTASAASSTSSAGSGGSGGDGTTSGTGGAGGGGGASGGAGGGGGASALCEDSVIGGNRPATVHVPPTYTCGVPAPLVILLHGYTSTGAMQDAYFNLTAESDKRGFLYVYPDGTKNSMNNAFWNATDACCNFEASTVDDSAYIASLIDEVSAKYAVDPKRVYLIGHSNGGFMSYRMACDHADKITAIASLAGAMWADVAECQPKKPVSVLQIHGTGDAVIAYDGGAIGANAYPSAETTVSSWATLNQCPGEPEPGAPVDIESSIAGMETTVAEQKGCADGTTAALWTIAGGSHVPTLSSEFAALVLDFLYAQTKP